MNLVITTKTAKTHIEPRKWMLLRAVNIIKTAVAEVRAVMSGPSRPCACRGGRPVVPASSRRARVLGNEQFVISIIFELCQRSTALQTFPVVIISYLRWSNQTFCPLPFVYSLITSPLDVRLFIIQLLSLWRHVYSENSCWGQCRKQNSVYNIYRSIIYVTGLHFTRYL